MTIRGYSFKLSGFVGIHKPKTWLNLFQVKSLGYFTFFSSIFTFSSNNLINKSGNQKVNLDK